MQLKLIMILLATLTLISFASARLAIFEAGDYAICINGNWEINKIGNLENWPIVAGFEKMTASDEYKHNVYRFEIASMLADDRDAGLVSIPIKIVLWRLPYDASLNPIFAPTNAGNVLIGRVMGINATLYSGDFTYEDTRRTANFVTFPINETTYCQVYDPNMDEAAFRDFLSGLDVISKQDLPSKLPLLWTRY